MKGFVLSQMHKIDKFIIAKEMGWTLEYVESLPPKTLGELKAFLNEYRKVTGGLL